MYNTVPTTYWYTHTQRTHHGQITKAQIHKTNERIHTPPPTVSPRSPQRFRERPRERPREKSREGSRERSHFNASYGQSEHEHKHGAQNTNMETRTRTPCIIPSTIQPFVSCRSVPFRPVPFPSHSIPPISVPILSRPITPPPIPSDSIPSHAIPLRPALSHFIRPEPHPRFWGRGTTLKHIFCSSQLTPLELREIPHTTSKYSVPKILG